MSCLPAWVKTAILAHVGGAVMGKPKTFSLHWGSGVIEEEAQIETPYHRPTVQLLRCTRGQAAGDYEIRLCHYDLKGRFQRSPLILDADDVPRLRRARYGGRRSCAGCWPGWSARAAAPARPPCPCPQRRARSRTA